MHARCHAFAGFVCGEARSERKASADSFGNGHDVGRNTGVFIGKKFTCPAYTALHFIKDQQQAVLIAQFAQAPQTMRRNRPHTALALNRLNQNSSGFRCDRAVNSLVIRETNLIEAFDLGAEAFEVFGLSTRRNGCQCPAVERTLKRDDPITLRVSIGIMIFARHLDRTFKRFGAGIGKKDSVGKRVVNKPLGQPCAFRDLVKIGGVPQFGGLILQGFDKMRMRMAKRIHGNTGCKIKIAIPARGDQPWSLASLERDPDPCKCRKQGGRRSGAHDNLSFCGHR